jgi:putative phage-type endonuclease
MIEAARQGSNAWHALRCGRVTASRVADLVARTKTGWGASRATYLSQLVVERLTRAVECVPPSAAMTWGTQQEPEARAAYQFFYDKAVTEVGFLLHPQIFMAGASPDGVVDDDGLIEIKCPNSNTHIDFLRNRTIPARYQVQMSWQMACTGRQWCDFVSYDPRLPERCRLFVTRFHRDDTRIAELEQHVRDFLDEVDSWIFELADQRESPEPPPNVIRLTASTRR